MELELSRFTVLIGEQATGKSTVAKLLAVCRYFSYIVNDNGDLGYLDNNFFEGLTAWGLKEFVKPDSYILYKNKDYTLTVANQTVAQQREEPDGNPFKNEQTLFLPNLSDKSEAFENLLNELGKIRPERTNKPFDLRYLMWTIPTSFFQNDVAAVMDNPFFIPTERGLQSIFSLGKSSIQNIADSLFNQLAELNTIARFYKNDTQIEPLDITYKIENGHGYIKKNKEQTFYSLDNGASGYQSTIPIVLVTKFYAETKRKSKTFIVEEPEMNLFPEAQQKLIEYLVATVINNRNSILITTHSPYVLTSLNNLIYAYKTGQSHPEETEKIINKKYWLNQEDISVYMLLPDGTCEDIMDGEEGMIKADRIDNVSRKLNSEFDLLQDIELGLINTK